jgi:hypothetical protein
MFPFRFHANFKYRFIFFGLVFVSNFVPLVVDHVIRVAIVSNCDWPITICTSLGKSISITLSASTFGMFGVFSSTLVGVEVFNVHVIVTSLKALEGKKKPQM